MQCPKCGFNQPDGLQECRKCGVIFAKAFRNAVNAESQIEAQPLQPEILSDDGGEEKKPAPLYLVAIVLLAIAAAAVWLHTPGGSPVPEQAYVNTAKGYALKPPEGWIMITPDNYKQLIAQYKNRFPKELSAQIMKPGFDISFIHITDDETAYSPNLNVVVTPLQGSMPSLNESEKNKAAKIITAEISKQLKTYTMESASIVSVDKIDALQISGTASMTIIVNPSEPIISEPDDSGRTHVTGYTSEESDDFTIKCVQTFVPGRGQGYIISCSDEQDSFLSSQPVFNELLKSFRVMNRPPRFGPVVMGALNGGMLGAAAYLLFILLGRSFKKKEN